MSDKVIRPRKKTVAASRVQRGQSPDPTSPGDSIELSITGEVTNRRGQKFWVRAGLASQHRDGETTEEACERIQSFVTNSVDGLMQEYLG